VQPPKAEQYLSRERGTKGSTAIPNCTPGFTTLGTQFSIDVQAISISAGTVPTPFGTCGCAGFTATQTTPPVTAPIPACNAPVCSGLQCGNTCYSYDPICTTSNGYGGPSTPAYCCGNYLCCPSNSPIIIDTKDEGFHLIGEPDGVEFALGPGEEPTRLSWTSSAYSNGWLALDRNGNGLIDKYVRTLREPDAPTSLVYPERLRIPRLFDGPAAGGNQNGLIDPGDAIYSSLRIWVDRTHNGISEPGELYTLPEVGLFSISLHHNAACYIRYKAV
jgi:hypothetical protein